MIGLPRAVSIVDIQEADRIRGQATRWHYLLVLVFRNTCRCRCIKVRQAWHLRYLRLSPREKCSGRKVEEHRSLARAKVRGVEQPLCLDGVSLGPANQNTVCNHESSVCYRGIY